MDSIGIDVGAIIGVGSIIGVDSIIWVGWIVGVDNDFDSSNLRGGIVDSFVIVSSNFDSIDWFDSVNWFCSIFFSIGSIDNFFRFLLPS